MAFDFKLEHTDGLARAGTITVRGKKVASPFFMPVGTAGSVKALPPEDLEVLGAEICLANTYHLYLRPGVDTVRAAGGLHRFMGWPGAVLTDSGGYQVFSLKELRTVDADGVLFRSHLDGSEHRFTPEKVYDIQSGLGTDIAMVLDVCTPYPADEARAADDLELTLDWARRTREHADTLTGDDQMALFGIVQGSVYPNLRVRSALETASMGFDGHAIGGLSVGEPKEAMGRRAPHRRMVPAPGRRTKRLHTNPEARNPRGERHRRVPHLTARITVPDARSNGRWPSKRHRPACSGRVC